MRDKERERGRRRKEECLGIQAYGGRIPPAEKPRPHHSLLELHQAAALKRDRKQTMLMGGDRQRSLNH